MKVFLPLTLLSMLLPSFLDGGEIGPPPAELVERLDLDPFYRKHLDHRGFPILASSRVSDTALFEAAYLIDRMLGDRDDILEAISANGVRLAIMAPDEFTTDIPEHSDLEPKVYWDKRARGLGATKVRPVVSVGEENLLGLRGDPYSTESIFVHEFAHVIHGMGLNAIDPEFQGRLEKAFNRAAIAGLWKGKYAGTNPSEYWAEAVQSWFDTNREDDFEHNHVDTREELREHDPGISALVESVFGDRDWRYRPPRERLEEPHLAGHDPGAAPEFSWPKDLLEAYAAIERGDGRKRLAMRSMSALEEKDGTVDSGKAMKLRFENKRGGRVSVFWIGFDGIRRHYADIDPGRRHEQSTYGSHLWVVVDEAGRDLGWVSAPEEDSILEIEAIAAAAE